MRTIVDVLCFIFLESLVVEDIILYLDDPVDLNILSLLVVFRKSLHVSNKVDILNCRNL